MPVIDRRGLLTGGAAAGIALGMAPAAAAPLPITARPIWPGRAPGGERVTVTEKAIPRSATGPADDLAYLNITRPMLRHLAPAKANGAAMLLVPGGGYARVALGREDGRGLLEQFTRAGYHAYVVTYRLPQDGWPAGHDAPLQDAQRALRMIRADAARLSFAPDRIGVAGFSAGGHLAGMLATRTDTAYRPIDAIDRQPLGVRAAALCYPVITMVEPFAHGGSRTNLIGLTPAAQAIRAASVETYVSTATPPVFLAHAVNDPVVPVDNSLTMFSTLRAHKVASEMHLFETGGHGLPGGTDGADPIWLQRLVQWAPTHGL